MVLQVLISTNSYVLQQYLVNLKHVHVQVLGPHRAVYISVTILCGHVARVGMGATFNLTLAHAMGDVIGTDL